MSDVGWRMSDVGWRPPRRGEASPDRAGMWEGGSEECTRSQRSGTRSRTRGCEAVIGYVNVNVNGNEGGLDQRQRPPNP